MAPCQDYLWAFVRQRPPFAGEVRTARRVIIMARSEHVQQALQGPDASRQIIAYSPRMLRKPRGRRDALFPQRGPQPSSINSANGNPKGTGPCVSATGLRPG